MNNWNLLTFFSNGWPLKMPPMPLKFLQPIHSLHNPFLPLCSVTTLPQFQKITFHFHRVFELLFPSPHFLLFYYSPNNSTKQKKRMPVDASNSGEVVQQQIIFGDFESAETEPEASSAFPPLRNSTMEDDGANEVCTNSHIISANTIIHFTEDMDAVMFVMTVASSFLQLYVIFAALKHIRRKTSDKCMHVFLLSMTVADFLLTALCYPVELAPRAGLIQKFPRFVSAIMHMLCWIGLIVSSISLVFLNLDKLFFFRFPLRYSNCFTRARAIYLVTASWVLSTTFVLFAWATESFHCVDEDCITLAIFPNRLHIYLPFMICVGVIPTVTSLVVAIYIMKVVGEHRRQIKAQEHLLRTPRESSPSTQRSHSAMAAKMRTFYFIFMTTVFTAFTLLPYRFAGLQRSLNPQRTNECLTIFLYWLMMYLVYLNSMLNPLLTVTVLPQYRLNFMNILLCRRNKTKHQHEQYNSVNRISSDIL